MQQEEFCRWWRENVRRAGQGIVAESATFLNVDQAEHWTGIDKRLKSIEASQRATGRVLGVSHTTVQNDLDDGKKLPPAASGTSETPPENNGSGKELPPLETAPTSPPAWFQDEKVDPAA